MKLQPYEALFCEHLSLPIQGTDMEQLKKDLTVNNGRRYAAEAIGVKTNEPPEIFLYRITGDRVIVPRHYVPKRLPGSLPIRYLIERYTRPKFDIDCHIELRDDIQRQAVEALQEKDENEAFPRDKILCLACGLGKAQPINEIVLTPEGWKEIGTIKVGDSVVGSDGKPTGVMGVFPQGTLDVFRVVFDDGASVECCKNHLWLTQTPTDRKYYRSGVVRSLEQIQKTLKTKSGATHSIQRCGPVHYVEQPPVKIDPWLLGFYIGNGSSSISKHNGRRMSFDSPHTEIHVKIQNILTSYGLSFRTRSSKIYVAGQAPTPSLNICTNVKFGRKEEGRIFWRNFVETGLCSVYSENKFIPKEYMYSSIEERCALLSGLLDSDGYKQTNASYEYGTSSKVLALQVQELVEGLGGRVHIAERYPWYTYKGVRKQGILAYRLILTGLWGENYRYKRRYIKDILPVGKKECVCISVNAADQLYVTRRFIVTHNTVCALYAAQKSDMFPALVVVHTTALLTQWVERIKEFYTLDDVPIIQGDKFKYVGYPIAVAMLQTLVSRTYKPEFYQYWRLVVVDEVHRLGAATFSQMCWQFPGERWGLSATPKRYDGMDIVFRMHLGEVCHEYLEQEIVPNVFLVDTESTLSPYKRYTLWNGELSIPKVITDLAENESRNNKILHFLEKSYHKGRTILVLGERLDQLRSLHDAMTECSSKAMCVGSMKAPDRTEALKARIIFATHQIAKEGLDKPELDTLFILIPFANEGRLQQSVGRILRKKQNKSKPVVVVFYDSGVEVMLAFSRKMKKWFLKNKYSVTEINC